MWKCRQGSTTTCRCNLAQIRQAGKDGFPGLHASCRLLHGGRGGAGSMSTLFAFLHHVAAFTLVSALAVEFILIGQEFSLATARRLVIADAVLGAAAGILLVVGLLRVFFFEKGADYYFHSHAFMTKFSVFIAVALLSIVPTLEFLSWRKALKSRKTPISECGQSCGSSARSSTASWLRLSSYCCVPRSWRAAGGSRDAIHRHTKQSPLRYDCTGRF